MNFDLPIRKFRYNELDIQLVPRKGRDTYHLQARGREDYTPRITNHERRDLLEGRGVEQILRRYFKPRR